MKIHFGCTCTNVPSLFYQELLCVIPATVAIISCKCTISFFILCHNFVKFCLCSLQCKQLKLYKKSMWICVFISNFAVQNCDTILLQLCNDKWPPAASMSLTRPDRCRISHSLHFAFLSKHWKQQEIFKKYIHASSQN